MNLFKKCTAEFIGTFAIVLAGCGAISVNQISDGAITHLGVAMAFGLVVMIMIYAVGHISGAHFNPAVTIAFSFRRHFPKKQIFPYISAQCLGAITASLIHAWTLTPILNQKFPGAILNLGVTQPIDNMFMTAFIWEILLTFFLMFVIMGVATDYRAIGKAAGLSIGGTVALDALFGGPLCGASMNPARSLGPALVSGNFNHFFAYILGPIIGAIFGALIYDFIRCEPKSSNEVKGCC
ncbi:Aquaporin Z [hydrothermal vent metagenome]|uniref:Aquaporin Z n=1 Tax=hydrothermal vent metagenome TaxID=652676 RepID=A0A3B1DG98_9ZZZZ